MGSQSVVVRFAGDSGDGVQLMGTQFVAATALAGNDFATFPDYPAEIRAPAGTTFGVSAYQIHLGARPITTAGDAPQVLVAFNPAALKVNLPLVAPGALIVLNVDSFTSRGLAKAGYQTDPRASGALDGYQVVEVDMTKATLDATEKFELSKSDAGRCKNFWALGLVQWMFNHDISQIEDWITKKFAKDAKIRDANLAALRAGHAYGETAELAAAVPHVKAIEAQFPPGEYRGVRGSEALSLGLAAAGELADRKVMFCSYPITPASTLLHTLARYGHLGVGVFQAEDEIAAICAAIGASYGGAIGVTSSSGPGIALKTEAIGLAINTELPVVIVDSQRGGPSTGLPTKTEQSDLYQAVYGRNADRADPRDRGAQSERLLRGRDRGGPDRAPAHDARDLADRRLPRERGRAVADPRRRQDPADRDECAARAQGRRGDRQRDLRSQCGFARPAVGRARHAGPDASRSAASRRTFARATSRTTPRITRR